MEKFIQILQLGLFEGLVWFPFVLAMGLLYNYLKDIDVSIDGLVVISSVVFVISFNQTESFLFSISLTLIVTVILYAIVHFIIGKLGVNSLLTGIIISLILHSVSVIIIGESLRLNYEALPIKVDNITVSIITILTAIFIYLFIRTSIGVKVLISAGYPYFNSSLSFFKSRLFVYVIAGLLVGVGAIIYSCRLGMARAGGGFEFLITTLCSFLFIEKVISYVNNILKRKNNTTGLINSIVFKSLIGSIIFQILVFAIIAYLHDPIYWKLLFGILLLLLVADFTKLKQYFSSKKTVTTNDVKLVISNLSYSYPNTAEEVFHELSLSFNYGLNIIWGSNGSGKSTLLNLINGNLENSKGRITYRTKDIKHYRTKIFSLRQNTFENIGIDFTLGSNNMASSGLTTSNWFSLYNENDELQNVLGASLSGGQAQRFSLKLWKAFKPLIALADEPTSGLDINGFKEFLNFLNSEINRCDIIIIVTHDERFKNLEANHINLDKYKA